MAVIKNFGKSGFHDSIEIRGPNEPNDINGELGGRRGDKWYSSLDTTKAFTGYGNGIIDTNVDLDGNPIIKFSFEVSEESNKIIVGIGRALVEGHLIELSEPIEFDTTGLTLVYPLKLRIGISREPQNGEQSRSTYIKLVDDTEPNVREELTEDGGIYEVELYRKNDVNSGWLKTFPYIQAVNSHYTPIRVTRNGLINYDIYMKPSEVPIEDFNLLKKVVILYMPDSPVNQEGIIFNFAFGTSVVRYQFDDDVPFKEGKNTFYIGQRENELIIYKGKKR